MKYFIKKFLYLLELPSFSAIWLLSLSIIRTLIEFDLQNSIALAQLSSIAHAVSYFVLCYAVTLFVFWLGLKKDISAAFKWTNIVFVILPFPPIIDHIFSSTIRLYQYAPKEHLLGNLITFFSKYGDASLGQQTLGIYIIIISFIAIYIARRRIIPAIAAPLALYIFSVFASIGWIRGLLPSGSYDFLEAKYMASRILHQGFTFFYIFTAILIFIIWWFILNFKTFRSLLISIRPIRSFHMVQMGIFGLLQSPHPVAPEMFGMNAISITLSILLGWWLVAFVNDYADFKIDRISNANRFHVCFPEYSRQAKDWMFWFGICSIILTMSLGIIPLVLFALYILGGIIYSLPPLRFRRNILSSSFIGLGSANLYLVGSTSYIPPNTNWWEVVNWSSALIILLGFGLSGFIKDEKDRVPDKIEGVTTIFTRFEYSKARKLAWFLLFCGWIIISLLSTGILAVCFSSVCIALSMYLYYKSKPVTWQILLFQFFFLFLNIYTFVNKFFVKNYIVW
ncbi:MAG: UbiA family prenyltransferase [Candidatus Aminicenantes bacterium]|nr:MAG: UbiA family prenyltransferase [Candidatus Aminicenantes bacterium]